MLYIPGYLLQIVLTMPNFIALLCNIQKAHFRFA